MRLQNFISETLKEIIAGVKEAQSFAASQGARVNPPWRKTLKLQACSVRDAYTGQLLQNVEFDVAVTLTEESEAKGGAGIFVAAIGLGVQGKTDISSSSISRVKFSVPVSLPIGRKISVKK